MKKINIGTSGFSYSSWKEKFYPKGVPQSKWLEYYCTRFNTLELNNTFYRFPEAKALKKFHQRTPDDFIFTVKAHKVITHSMRLKDAKSKVDEFLSVVHEGLEEKTGCILFQLPPSFSNTEENLERVISSIPHHSSNVIEFRNESWWNEKTIAELKKHNLTFCNVSFPGLPETFYKTTDIFYLRMHGVPKLFQSSYSTTQLENIKKKLPKRNAEIFVYFNNTMYEAGYSNAGELKNLAG